MLPGYEGITGRLSHVMQSSSNELITPVAVKRIRKNN